MDYLAGNVQLVIAIFVLFLLIERIIVSRETIIIVNQNGLLSQLLTYKLTDSDQKLSFKIELHI